MASDASTATAANGTDALLQSLVRGGRGRALRAHLAARYPDCSPDAIEEAIQYACKSFLDEAEGIAAPGQVYAWIRTAAHRSLGREADLHHRELVVDPVEDGLEQISAEDAGPAEELIALEDDADLSMLVEERQPDFYSGGSGADMLVAPHDGADVDRRNSGHDEAWVAAADDLRGASCEELHHAGFG